MEGTLDPGLLQQYAIVDREADFENALQNSGGKVLSGGLVSVKSSKTKVEKHGKQKDDSYNSNDKKRGNDNRSGSKLSNKKRKS